MVESSLDDDRVNHTKEEGLVLVFYHLLINIYELIDRSPYRRGKIEIERGENSIIITENSPSNYSLSKRQRAPRVEPFRARKVA